MPQNLVQILLQLARVDGEVSPSELALIHKIAVVKGIPMFELEQIIQGRAGEPVDLKKLSKDDKFEYIYAIVLLMKMDGKLDNREIRKCNQYAESLGYQKDVINTLSEMIKSDHELSENKEALKKEVQRFLA